MAKIESKEALLGAYTAWRENVEEVMDVVAMALERGDWVVAADGMTKLTQSTARVSVRINNRVTTGVNE